MPGELFWNAPIGKEEDSDQDTFVLMSSSDFDTPNSLDNSKDFNNSSFDIPVPTTMTTKYSGGDALDQPGPSGLNSDSKENRIGNELSTSFSGLGAGNAAGGSGGGDDRRGNDRRQIPGDGNLEDDSHEPIPSGSSTSSSSIPVLAPVDPALDINTADLWPNNGDRNGHSDESGLSQATTAVVSDADSVQNDSIANPLLGATSSTSTSSGGSKNILKPTSGGLDISSASLSTLSSSNSIISSYDEKKNSSSDTSLGRMDTSTLDISGDHGVDGILTNDEKLEEDFHSSHIDIFNNSGEPCTSTPSDEIGILEFHDQSNLLSTQDDNDVIPSTQEDLQKISFAVPSVPLLGSSSSSKRKADSIDDQSGVKKVSRLSLKIPSVNTPSPILPVPTKKFSESALALDKFKKYIERGLGKSVPATVHRPPWERLIDELNSDENDFNSELVDKDAALTVISRKLLFDSSQSSSDPSSSESSFKPIDVARENSDINDENLTAAIVQETCGDLLSKVLNDKVEDATKPNPILESQEIECSQENETQSIIESSQSSNQLNSAKRDATTNFELRYTPTLLDMESQYFPFEEDPKLTNTEPQSNKIEGKSVENVYEVPESEVSDAEQVQTCSKQDSSELKKQTKQDPGNVKVSEITATGESLDLPEKKESETTTEAMDDGSRVAEDSQTLSSKRELEISDAEVNLHKRRKFKESETSSFVSSTSGNSTEIASVYKVEPKKDDSAKLDVILNYSNKRDQEVQTIEIEDKEDEFRNNNVNNDCVRRKTVIIKRIVIEEFIRNGRVYKKTTEEINDDPIVQEYHKDDNDTQTYSGSPNAEKNSPKERLKKRNSSSCLSSNERSGTSSGWLGDLSASPSKSSNSSSGTKASSKGITPRLTICPINEIISSGSSSGMKTLRSDKSITENEEVAFSTPKQISESPKVKKRDVKSHKHVDSKKPIKSAVVLEKTATKRKVFKRRPRNEPMVRKLVNEESGSPSKKPSKSSENKTPPPREQLILKLNLKSSSIISPSRMDDSRTLKPGVRVMAKYRDGYYYPGRAVDQERADRWKILYDDGDTRSIRMENILVVELLPVGQSIYVLSQDGFYDSAIIYGYADINGEIQYAIEMDEGSKRQVKQSAVILTTDQAACMEKLPLGTMHGYTSICLDNIIEGKRRSRDLPSDSSSKSSRRERASTSANEESDHSTTPFKSSK